jgi:glycosyltransferase involved in cell wall biosynthesis
MHITVILCTYNRCQSLAKTLETVAASRFPNTVEWEVLVVDNNSNDRTHEVVDEFCQRYPRHFRYVFEPRQGLCRARNAGIREARGDILAFVDDDVTVEPTWLQNLTASLHDGQWAGAGGRIRAQGDFSPPRWLALDGPYSMVGVLVLFDRGDKPGEIDWAPYGANMAFRREMFEKYGGFRTDLDRCGNDLIGGGDTEFGQRLMSAGERLRYEPSAVVYHPVPDNRLSKRYFLSWWFNFGRASVRTWGRKPDIGGIPRPYLSILKAGTTTMVEMSLRWLLASKPEQRFFYKARVWREAGSISEFYRLARRKDAEAK